MSKLWSAVASIVVVIVATVAVNAGALRLQDWYHADDVAQCEQLKSELDELRSRIASSEFMAATGDSGGSEYYRRLASELSQQYNAKTMEYNLLAEKAYRRWTILPRARGGTARAPVRP